MIILFCIMNICWSRCELDFLKYELTISITNESKWNNKNIWLQKVHYNYNMLEPWSLFYVDIELCSCNLFLSNSNDYFVRKSATTLASRILMEMVQKCIDVKVIPFPLPTNLFHIRGRAMSKERLKHKIYQTNDSSNYCLIQIQ